jgi:hypothetical protein
LERVDDVGCIGVLLTERKAEALDDLEIDETDVSHTAPGYESARTRP